MKNRIDDNEKIELLKYNISRFDHYYASVNFKSSFLVIGNITIIGFLISNKNNILDYIFFANLLLTTLSLVFILMAINPFTKSYHKNGSIIFFGDIANSDYNNFSSKINKLSKKLYISDLQKQVYILSIGLKKKFSHLKVATIIFIINIVLFFGNIGFIYKNNMSPLTKQIIILIGKLNE